MADLKNTITAGNARLWSDDLLQFYPNGSVLKYGPNAADVYNTDTYPLIQSFTTTPTSNDEYTITSGSAGQQLFDLANTKSDWVSSDNGNSDASVVQYTKQLDTPIKFQLTGGVTAVVNDWSGDGDNVILNATVTNNSHTHLSANITDATSDNTANMVVKRDNSGDFSAGTISAEIDGNAASATKWKNPRILTTTLTGDVSGTANVSVDGTSNKTTTITAVVADDSHTHQFNNITNKTSGTGDYATTGNLISGKGSGGVALTINDGQGNANVTFNHTNGVPEQDGNSARIVHNSDDTSNSSLTFEIISNVISGNSIDTTPVSAVYESGLLLFDNKSLLIGGSSTSPDVELFSNGSHLYMDLNSTIGNFYIRDESTVRYTFNDNGSFTATGNVTAFSDIKLKKDINVITDPLEKINNIRGVTYKRADNDELQCGVIAQEVQKVLPEVVISNVDPETGENTLSVAYGNMVGLLIEGIKELKTEINELKTPWYKKILKTLYK